MSLPVDILITEHKLILQAVEGIKQETNRIQTNQTINLNSITTAVDFFRTYADRFHHGKEEGILFKELSQKKLGENVQKVMNELITEHVLARKTVTALEEAKEKYLSGKAQALTQVLDALNTLIKLYPAHIEKEDEHFFYPCMVYFSEKEQENMLSAFLGFNQEFTDKRYKQIIALLG